jgi:nucleoside-diphosphate-sugar epimerase
MLNEKKILITGATGFVGACLTHKLVEMNCDVYLFSRKTSNKWRIANILDSVKNFNVDLKDYDQTEQLVLAIKPDIIYHLATYGGYSSQKDFNKIMETNVFGTANLLNACAKIDFECFVNTGSSSEYGLKMHPMSENDVLEPINDYGVSKACATLYCQSLAKSTQLPIVTLRLFSPYGYYEEPTRLIPYVIKSCLLGENPKLTSASSVRDFIFIQDVIDVYLEVINSNFKHGEIFNVGAGEQHSIEEIVKIIIELTGNKVQPQWGALTRRLNEPDMWCSDNSKIRHSLKWIPKYDLRNGLKKTIDWVKDNLKYY